MNQNTEGNFVLGFSSKESVKLDFDNTSFRVVKQCASDTMKWFNLKGLMILKSSNNSYHVLFDRKVSWRKNVRIMAWICLISQNAELIKWFIMQCIEESSTLRISPKEDKKTPRIVYRYGSQNKEIREFLKYRKLASKCYNTASIVRDLRFGYC